ncbi:MAG: hypothetical protein QOD39_5264 [Mycobacterium sp.]|jgi:hypothetical protein|nr:hypothetical protein [Mycobacterium sp.]
MFHLKRVRPIVACSLTISTTVALVGCSGSKDEAEQTSTTTAAAGQFDLSKLSELRDDFPPDFIPGKSEVVKLQHILVAGVGSVVSYGKPYTVDPPQCTDLLKPVAGVAGADTIGMRADGPDGRSISVGADMPVNVAADIPTTGCERMTYVVPDERRPFSGTVERIDAPTIDGATTLAFKCTVDGVPDTEYSYAAILGGRVLVKVDARLAQDFQAQPLLPALVVKAVAAIRSK